MQISLAKHDEANQDHSGMEVLQHDLQQLEHRISSLSRHRFVTYGVTALSIASGLVFFLLALSDTLPGPLRHVTTHVAGYSGFFSGQLPVLLSEIVLLVGLTVGVARFSAIPMIMGIGMSTMLYFGSLVIGGVTSAYQQPSSCSSSGAHPRTLGCMLQAPKDTPTLPNTCRPSVSPLL
jgi:hypothetical protein